MNEHPKKLSVGFRMLVWATLICFCFVGFRIVSVGMTNYLFLVWNLFLAWLPLLFADAAMLFHQHKNKFRFWIFTFLWFIFFPNAPYIVTDYIHINPWATIGIPWWYDFIMITIFAFTGILLGLCSLQTIKKLTVERLGLFWSWFFMVLVSFLSGFGIYLGRVLRWNSWDFISNPQELFSDIGMRFIDPISHPLAWFISLLFGALVISSYLIFDHFCVYRREHKKVNLN
jgi:uncharacterized membrane protein